MMNETNETDFIAYEACPKCQSNGNDTAGDNLARYSDGHAFCFSCKFYQHSNDLKEEVKQVNTDLITGEYTSFWGDNDDSNGDSNDDTVQVNFDVFSNAFFEDEWQRNFQISCPGHGASCPGTA